VFCDRSIRRLANCGIDTFGSFVQWIKSEKKKKNILVHSYLKHWNAEVLDIDSIIHSSLLLFNISPVTKQEILWHIDPLLGTGCETMRQQPLLSN
jgi:hypothetical protein